MPGWFEPVFITLVVVLYLGMWPLILWAACATIDHHYKPQNKGK